MKQLSQLWHQLSNRCSKTRRNATTTTGSTVSTETADLQVQIESRKATLIAEFMDDYAKAEKETLNQIEGDPLLKN